MVRGLKTYKINFKLKKSKRCFHQRSLLVIDFRSISVIATMVAIAEIVATVVITRKQDGIHMIAEIPTLATIAAIATESYM